MLDFFPETEQTQPSPCKFIKDYVQYYTVLVYIKLGRKDGIYSESCLNLTLLEQVFVFGIDRYSVYTG